MDGHGLPRPQHQRLARAGQPGHPRGRVCDGADTAGALLCIVHGGDVRFAHDAGKHRPSGPVRLPAPGGADDVPARRFSAGPSAGRRRRGCARGGLLACARAEKPGAPAPPIPHLAGDGPFGAQRGPGAALCRHRLYRRGAVFARRGQRPQTGAARAHQGRRPGDAVSDGACLPGGDGCEAAPRRRHAGGRPAGFGRGTGLHGRSPPPPPRPPGAPPK